MHVQFSVRASSWLHTEVGLTKEGQQKLSSSCTSPRSFPSARSHSLSLQLELVSRAWLNKARHLDTNGPYGSLYRWWTHRRSISLWWEWRRFWNYYWFIRLLWTARFCTLEVELKASELSDEVDWLSHRLKFADVLLFRISGKYRSDILQSEILFSRLDGWLTSHWSWLRSSLNKNLPVFMYYQLQGIRLFVLHSSKFCFINFPQIWQRLKRKRRWKKNTGM